ARHAPRRLSARVVLLLSAQHFADRRSRLVPVPSWALRKRGTSIRAAVQATGLKTLSAAEAAESGYITASTQSLERTRQAETFGDAVAGHLVGNRSDAPQTRVAPVALHVGFCGITHAAENLDTQIGCLHRPLGCLDLQHARFHMAGLAGRQKAGGMVQQQFGGMAPHRDIGNIVLQYLELADDLAEGLALLHVFKCVFEHAIDN